MKRLVFMVGSALLATWAAWFLFNSRQASSQRETSLDRAVAAAAADYRVLESRLAGPFVHRGFDGESGDRMVLPSLALIGLEARVSEALRQEADPDTLHASALLTVMVDGHERALEEAVSQLEDALSKRPDDHELANDISACLYTYSLERDAPRLLGTAFDAVNRALEIEPQMAEALFNKALILEAMYLPQPAMDAWDRYLETEQDSAWKNEALERVAFKEGEESRRAHSATLLIELSSRLPDDAGLVDLARNHPVELAEFIEDKLLPAWLDGNRDALKRAHVLAEALGRVTGDSFLRDSIDAINHGSPQAFARAFDSHTRGMTALNDEDYTRGVELFSGAEALFGSESPHALLSQYKKAVCRQNTGNRNQALATINNLLQKLKEHDYHSLHGDSLWTRGYILQQMGSKDEALRNYEQSLIHYGKAGNYDRMAGIHGMISQSLLELGQSDAAWFHVNRALDYSNRVRDPFRLYQINLFATLVAWQSGRTNLSGHYAQAMRDHAEDNAADGGKRSRGVLINAYRWLARVNAGLGNHDEALSDIHHARRLLEDSQQDDTDAEAELLAVESELSPSPEEAADLAERALNVLKRTGNMLNRAALLAALARAHKLAGRPFEMRDSLQQAIDIHEWGRGSLPPDLRWSFFNSVLDLYTQMTALHLRLGEYETAFDWSERMRARLLLDEASNASAGATPFPLACFRDQIPVDTILVSFLVIEGERHVFVVGRNQFTHLPLNLEEHVLKQLVIDLHYELRNRRSGAGEARAIYEALISPIEDLIPSGALVVFIPDETLQTLPWAALHHPERGYLIEHVTPTIGSSANLYIQSLSRLQSSKNMALLVGATHFDAGIQPDLAQLPNVEQEVEEIKAENSHARILVGEQATVRAFEQAAGEARVIHIAGHALQETMDYPGGFLLAPDSDHNGLLDTERLAGLDLSNADLVILSACNTGVGHSMGLEGNRSIVRSFLAAGAMGVLASYLPIDDRSAAEFMLHYHRNLARGLDPARAANVVQRFYIDHHRPPWEWAVFGFFGNSR